MSSPTRKQVLEALRNAIGGDGLSDSDLRQLCTQFTALNPDNRYAVFTELLVGDDHESSEKSRNRTEIIFAFGTCFQWKQQQTFDLLRSLWPQNRQTAGFAKEARKALRELEPKIFK